jgi:hypothetical protein
LGNETGRLWVQGQPGPHGKTLTQKAKPKPTKQKDNKRIFWITLHQYVWKCRCNITIPWEKKAQPKYGISRKHLQIFMLARQTLCHFSYTSSLFCFAYFGCGALWTTCPSRPQTAILPISASQVARITGVSHWLPARDWVLT